MWNLLKKLGNWLYSFVETFRYGNWKTRLSFVIFGFGNLSYGQIGRGLLLLLYEGVFIWYMLSFGGAYLAKLGTLGTVETYEDPETGFKVIGDNSFGILLYSVLTLVILVFTLFIWIKSIRMAYENQENESLCIRLATTKDDVQQALDHNFHTTLLSVPLLTLVVFTVVPLIFMILVAFTNYDGAHPTPNKLFTWVGWSNFSALFNGESVSSSYSNFSYAFWKILGWTLIWAVAATFTNFFFGLMVAMLINRKGIKLKKLWRTILVIVVAIPQFISLLLMSKMLRPEGVYNTILTAMNLPAVDWLLDPTSSRWTVILVNMWIGIPFTMLSTTGILMNIPSDLYEAARIDGANQYKMFTKITLPYVMFVMGPSLIQTFVGNLNNFNVIFLLTGGSTGTTDDPRLTSCAAGSTDLLITWLYKLTVGDATHCYYNIASVIGIIVFLISAFFSLVIYRNIGSVKNEEEFQ
jgi:arabinogalactan oligomer/maltooligosaccharide transport system permease protein